MNTTTAQVFVDDFVSGRLPAICVVTGQPTADRITRTAVVDGPSPAWALLILLGPIGWLALLVIIATARRTILSGELPMSEAAYEAARHRDRLRWAFVGGTVVLALVILVSLRSLAIGGAGLVLLSVAAAALTWMAADRRSWPRISLDASRRWVAVTNVHPEFAGAATDRRSLEDSHR